MAISSLSNKANVVLTNLPEISDKSVDDRLSALENSIRLLIKELEYILSNLGEENLSIKLKAKIDKNI